MSSLFKGLFGIPDVRANPVNQVPNEGGAPPPPAVLGLINIVDQMPAELEGQAPVAGNNIGENERLGFSYCSLYSLPLG
ncbi:hypothetical protein RSAG8_08028, partial [Rhizoctonia solani AG-8 WAC10335]